MKKLTFLSNLWSRVAGSQRNDVEFDRRLTVGSPSGFTINWTLKLVSALAILLTVGVSNAWGAVGSTITNASNIADATVYYFAGIGKSSKTYYSVLGSDEEGTSITGNANATKSNGTKYTFLIEGDYYYILSPNGYYVSPGSSNGKLNLSSSAQAVDVSTESSKIRISRTYNTTEWSFQKNKGTDAANFGGYKNTQSDLTLHVAGYRVIYDKNGATSGTVPSDATVYGDNQTATIKANTGSLAKTGYTFVGWNTAANGSGTDVAASGSATRTITAGLRLYAKWTVAASCDNVPTVTAGSLKGSVTSSSSATVQCTGGITNIGGAGCSLTSYGFAVGTSSNPTIGGTLTGTGKTYEVGSSIAASTGFENVITGLSASTTYHVRPYATNGAGTGYGADFTITTLAACTAAPTVTAGSTGTITSTSAVLNCSSGISKLGTGGCAIESYGFVMNTTGTPTISDTKYEVGTTYTTTGTSFTKTIPSGLTEGTTYYVRPYATNGYDTGYGTQTSFSTPKITVSETARAFGDRAVGGSYTMTFTVSGTYLQSNISIAKSGTNSSLFSIDNATVTQTNGTAPTTTITVTYAPTSAGSHSATLTLSSTNATSKTVALSGAGKYKITWMVNGSENSTSLVASGGNPTFPTAPSSCDAKKVFVGWTETNIGSTPTDVAPTFITTATTISANKTYYAVFAKRGRFDRVTGPSSLAAGQELVIVSNKFSTAITTGIGYASQPTEDADTLTSATTTEAMIWLLTGNSSDGWRITKPGDGNLLGVASLPSNNNSNTATLSANNTNSTWGIGQSSNTTNVLYISNKTTVTCALEASSASTNWVVYNAAKYNSNDYCALKVYASTLSKFITTCCATNVSLSHNSPEHGTIAFGSTSVATCGGDQDVSLTITPDAGYQLATYSVTTGSGKVATKNDPGISLNNNSNAVQNKTLTFASGVNGAYEVTASFTKMAPTACVWKYNGEAIPNPISLYVGQTAQLDATYTPSGLLNSEQDYTVTKSANLTQTSKTYSSPDVHYTFRADAAMDDGTVTLTNKINTSLSTTVHVHVDELPRVHFVDLVHGKEFADVVATISDNALNPNKTMKTSVDWTTPNANDCEEQHLHLAGWILSTWADANPDATHSEIAGAGATNFYAPGAAINVLTNNGNTYYAVWAKEE